MLIGYARCSTEKQDLEIQRETLGRLGVEPENIFCDHGVSGAQRVRPGLDQALAAVLEGDTLVVASLDRLARSVKNAGEISQVIEKRGARLQIGSVVHDPSDPVSRLFFNIVASFAELERGVISQRTKEGMAKARAAGKLKGRGPKLNEIQQAHVRRMVE